MTEARTYMDGYTDLFEQSFELNLNNYGPEDVERLNDWAIKAYAALEALQAEIERLTIDRRVLQADGNHPAPCAKFCEATAFTIELRRAQAKIERLKEEITGLHEDAAGTSPVEPSQTQPVFVSESLGHLTASGVPKTIDQFQLALNAAFAAGKVVGASPQPKMVTPYITQEHFDKAFPVNVPPSQAQPPAPSEAAREYMTGYSDGREWAKPSQALAVEPVYQYQLANGNWIDQTKESYDYNVKHGQATVRMLYATPQAAAQPEPYGYHSPKTGKVYASTEAASMAMAGEVKTVYLATQAQPSQAGELSADDVRAAGGIVHSDGNIFFTNIGKLNAAINAKESK